MKTFKLYWAPEGRCIATVQAETGWEARKMAPVSYRRYLGEVYSVWIDDITGEAMTIYPNQEGSHV